MELIILGHILGDFYAQTDKIAKKKMEDIKYMFIHCLIYTIIVGISFRVINPKIIASILLWIGVLCCHFIVDLIKRQCDKRFENIDV